MPTKAQLVEELKKARSDNKALLREIKHQENSVNSLTKKVLNLQEEKESLTRKVLFLTSDLKEVPRLKKENARLTTNSYNFSKLSWFERAFSSREDIIALLK